MLNYFEHHFYFRYKDKIILHYQAPDLIVNKPAIDTFEWFEQKPMTAENWDYVLEMIFNIFFLDKPCIKYRGRTYKGFKKFFAAHPDAQVIVAEEYGVPMNLNLQMVFNHPDIDEALALLRDHLTGFSLDKLAPVDYNKVIEWDRKASEDENDSSTV